MSSRILFLIAVFAWLFIIFSPMVAQQNVLAQSQPGSEVSLCLVQHPNTVKFPIVEVSFRLTSRADLMPITSITESELRFYENNKTEVHLLPGLHADSNSAGLDYYFILDRGNRSDQGQVRSILQDFDNKAYYNQQLDTVKIYTNEDNRANVYYPGVSGGTVRDAILNYPIDEKNKDLSFRSVSNSLRAALDEIDSKSDACARMPIIILVIGDNALPEVELDFFVSRMKESTAKVVLFHLPVPSTKELSLQNKYLKFTQDIKGIYVSLPNADALETKVTTAFGGLTGFRQIFSASYRTRYGDNGKHNILASYQANLVQVQGNNSYTIQRQPANVSITNGDISIQQASEQDTTRTLLLSISWQDNYLLELQKQAKLHITDTEGLEEIIPITLIQRGDDYEFAWDFGSKVQQQTAKFRLFVEVFNEFGESLQTPVNQVTINPFIPEEVSDGGEIPFWLILVLGGMALFFVFVLIIFFIIFQKFRSTSAQTPQEFLKSATENIKKTIVGGSNKRKPLALLYIVDGPKKMVGQDINIITERVNLGRDPQKTDMTFYDLETNSSISGLHAIIERVNSAWRITAVSESRSETFVNGVAIDFQKPKELHSGDMVRLGYLARQPVEFQFISDIENRLTAALARPTLSRAGAVAPSADIKDDITITVDVQAENSANEYEGDKTAIETIDDPQTNIGLSPEEKQKLQSLPGSDVDDFINQLRGGK